MPIYDQGYQRWKGELQRYPVRWWPIVRHGVMDIVKQRKYLLLLIFCWLGPFAHGVRLFFARPAQQTMDRLGAQINLPSLGGLFSDGMEFYYAVLQQQSFAVLIIVLFVGSDLIAQDRRHNALQLYFSKPLTLNDYIFGKLGILAGLIVFVTWMPLMLLWLFALSLSLRADYLASVWTLPLVATAYVALMIGVMGLLILALSSIGRRAIFIAVSFFILFGYGPMQGVTAILSNLTGNDYWNLLQVAGDMGHVGAWWFNANPNDDYHPLLSLIVCAIVAALSYLQLRKRVKPIEVVL